VFVVYAAEASKEEKWLQPADPAVLSSIITDSRMPDITTQLHIASFAYIGGRTDENIRSKLIPIIYLKIHTVLL